MIRLVFLSLLVHASLQNQENDALRTKRRVLTSHAVIFNRDLSFLMRQLDSHGSQFVIGNFNMSGMDKDAGQQRHKRSLFSSTEQQAIVDKHNELRRMEGASNMDKVVWSDQLAACAEGWANGCNWGHGQPSTCLSGLTYSALGQNLYAVSGARTDPVSATQEWYNEKKFYDYDTSSCKPGQQCGHYTQVVAGECREVGCAYATCAQLSGTNPTLTNAGFIVCNYGPAGNVVGKKPFLKGTACTKCSDGQGWCDNGLCNNQCSGPSSSCGCPLKCSNCGELDANTCKCRCKPGWSGFDCSDSCVNTNSKCNANPGWPPEWCTSGDYQKDVRQQCPVMCALCVPSDNPVRCTPSLGVKTHPDLHRTALLTSLNILLALFFAST